MQRLRSIQVLRAFALPLPAGHLRILDGWRGLCILLVIGGHFVPGLAPLAQIGVQFFFALSGRLMAEILILKRQATGLFVRRRIARIVPALATYVAVAAIGANVLSMTGGGPATIESPLGALLFFHNYVPAALAAPQFQHTWSLAVEEHSYLLLLLVAVCSKRRPALAAAVALAICGLSLLVSLWLHAHVPDGIQGISLHSEVRVSSVLLPFAATLFLAGHKWPSSAIGRDLAACATVLAVMLTFAQGVDSTMALAASTVLSTIAVVSIEASQGSFRWLLQTRLLVWAGTLSFSLYLWQQMFFVSYVRGYVPSPLAVLLAVACALLSFRLVENPARTFLNTHWARRSKEKAPTLFSARGSAGAHPGELNERSLVR